MSRLRRVLLAAAAAGLLILAACARSTRVEPAAGELAGREQPLHAWDATGAPGLEPTPPPTTWVHYHQMDVSFHSGRLPEEPLAPEGTTRATLVPVPGCRCGDAVLALLDDEIHLPDRALTLPLSGAGGTEVPEVVTEIRDGTVWAWVDRARSDTAYTIYVSVDPPEAMAADAFAVVTRDEFARYPVRTPARSAAGRFIRIESMRHLEVPSR